MKYKPILIIGLAGLFFSAFLIAKVSEVPRVFSEEYLEGLLLPLADSTITITHVPDSQYYALDETVIYKTYPLYLPGREPEGYYEMLRDQEPEIAFNENDLVSEQDWIRAGELVYDWALSVNSFDSLVLPQMEEALHRFNLPVTPDGRIPFFNLVIREKGKIEMTGRSCNTCHTKVMPDGSILKGGQGNYNFDQNFGANIQRALENTQFPDSLKSIIGIQFGQGLFNAYWLNTPAQQRLRSISNDDFINTLLNTYGGVMHRHGTVIGSPTSIPDLYNMEDRKYLDHTGLMRHRGIEDVMLYATLNEQADRMDKYADQIVIAPWPSEEPRIGRSFSRYSDAQLYALAKFIYSLEAPENPENFPAEMLKRGEIVFQEQGCVTCHTPPLFTNNKLTPVDGFEVPEAHKKMYDIFDISVETDPVLAMESRRGTGYYKVPGLIGVWNRQALLHDGSIRSLEELLDPARLEDGYQRKGFRPAWIESGPVIGHPFGLELSQEDKNALIAYLKKI